MPTHILPETSLPAEIVLTSGGSKGTIVLGAAWYLQKLGFFDGATTYSGTSVGAIVAAGLILGRNCRTMLELAIRHPIEPHVLPARFGVDSGRGLVKFIRKLLNIHGKMTLGDIYARTGKTLRVCVCNLSKRAPEYWTHETHPEVSLVHALRVSCTIPFMFSAVTFRGDLYVDGAIVDSLPVVDPAKALAIGFRPSLSSIETMEGFIEALHASMKRVKTAPRYFVQLDSEGVDPLDFSPEAKTMRDAFASGRDQASKWVKKIK